MIKIFRSGVILFLSLILIACGDDLELTVNARINGEAAPQARIIVDGEEQGVTDASGIFRKKLTKKAGAEVEVQVVKEQPGYRIDPWSTRFLMRLPKDGQIDQYKYDANLVARRYITLAVTEKDIPLEGAVVKSGRKDVGETDAEGIYVYEYLKLPKKGLNLVVSKPGYSLWRKTGQVEPGDRFDISLSKQAIVKIRALTEEYGVTTPVRGVKVNIGRKYIGKTNSKGYLTYKYKGKAGKRTKLLLRASGRIPRRWTKTITLNGLVNVQRYFYRTKPKPIRIGIYRFSGNTPGVDLTNAIIQTENALAVHLFKYAPFREVSSKKLRDEIARRKLKIDRITKKGWRHSRLRRTVDMIVLGSVAKDENGYLIEAKFYSSRGKLVHSQITRASKASHISRAARKIASNVLENFPFEGAVVAKEGKRYVVNIGRPYRISRGTEFTLTTPTFDRQGKITGYRDTGRLIVKRSSKTRSRVVVDSLKKSERVRVGDRVVRRIYRADTQKRYFVLSAQGGVKPNVKPLLGVNIYLNGDWVGATGRDGKTEVPVRIGRTYNMVLYRHGYKQVSKKIKINQNKETKVFVLGANNAKFIVDSQPGNADIYLDGELIGKTPLTRGVQVPLGFHTVKITVGKDYRDWEEVVEFDQKIKDLTGARKIVLHKDYLKIGAQAMQNGNIDTAIKAYSNTQKGHPDYSEARRALGQIYLDHKDDYKSAISEFENVLSLPENQQLIHKQYAVTFTNLGHAYYENGNSLIREDRKEAAMNLAQAIKNLEMAKQNTRFFPTKHYDEALHDTHYYLALAYHKLYLITQKSAVQDKANIAWREYFDFFPKKLEGQSDFEQSREAAREYWAQIKE